MIHNAASGNWLVQVYNTGSASKISFEESIVGESRAEKMWQGNVMRHKELPQIIHDNIPEKKQRINLIESNVTAE